MWKLIIACWRLGNPDGASDRAVEWICGEGGSEIADAEASSIHYELLNTAVEEPMQVPAHYCAPSRELW